MLNETSPMRETEQISETTKDQLMNDLIQTSVAPCFEEFKGLISEQKTTDSKPLSDTKPEIAEVFVKEFGLTADKFHRAFIKSLQRDDLDDSKTEEEEEDLELIKEINEEFSPLYKKFSDEKLYSGYGGPNCACFALDVTHDKNGEIFTRKPGLGHWSGECSGFELNNLLSKKGSDDRLFEILEADCEALGKGFKRVDENYVPKEGEILGAMMYSTIIGDFHFVRAGKGDLWFHKQGIYNPVMTDLSGRFITKPEDSDWGQYDQFCGRFVTWNK